MTTYISRTLVLLTAALTVGCTMANLEPPPLSGPSEMSLALTMTASPDVLSIDGSSQTLVTVEARDANGQLVPNVPLRLEILANGVVTDFGSLSARTLVTGPNGRAQFTYTAPGFVGGPIPDVQIAVTPTGTDASTHIRRVVSVRLVEPGNIGSGPSAQFTYTPESPAAFTDVRFDGSTSVPALGTIITSYAWDFGDGTTGSGAIATHQYRATGTFIARLTVTDSNGRTNTHSGQSVNVGAGEGPTAVFLYSPEQPVACSPVFFNATQSTAGGNHRIVSYNWSWGDGTPNQGGSTRSHTYDEEGSWVVVLTVTDEAGQKAFTSQTVTVGAGPSPCP